MTSLLLRRMQPDETLRPIVQGSEVPWMRNWVYQRRGQPCFVCATKIEMFRQGDFQRTTYFCPHCQPQSG